MTESSESTTDPIDTKTRLLKAAMVEFAEKGFESATVRDICQRANANLNAVKYYFVDKRGLYVETVKEAHRLQLSHMKSPDIDPTLDASEQLRLFITNMLQMATAKDDNGGVYHRLMLRELADPGKATEEIVRQFIGPRFARLNQILAELTGPNVSDTDRRLLAFSVVGECMHYRVAKPVINLLWPADEIDKLNVERISAHICGVIQSSAERMRIQSQSAEASNSE